MVFDREITLKSASQSLVIKDNYDSLFTLEFSRERSVILIQAGKQDESLGK